jgi:hypothetical protein
MSARGTGWVSGSTPVSGSAGSAPAIVSVNEMYCRLLKPMFWFTAAAPTSGLGPLFGDLLERLRHGLLSSSYNVWRTLRLPYSVEKKWFVGCDRRTNVLDTQEACVAGSSESSCFANGTSSGVRAHGGDDRRNGGATQYGSGVIATFAGSADRPPIGTGAWRWRSIADRGDMCSSFKPRRVRRGEVYIVGTCTSWGRVHGWPGGTDNIYSTYSVELRWNQRRFTRHD